MKFVVHFYDILLISRYVDLNTYLSGALILWKVSLSIIKSYRCRLSRSLLQPERSIGGDIDCKKYACFGRRKVSVEIFISWGTT